MTLLVLFQANYSHQTIKSSKMQSCRPAAGEGIPFKWWLLGTVEVSLKDAGRGSGNTQEKAGGDEEGEEENVGK